MAAGALCIMRLSRPTWTEEFHGDLLSKLRGHNYTGNIWHFLLKYEGTFSNGKTEISAPDNVFDGTTTPAVVYVDSTSGDDTAAGNAVQEVSIIGIDENDLFVVVPVATGGTTGQSSVTKFKRIFHAYCSAWGTNKDATGVITVQDDVAGTNKYLTIGAGANDSDGSAIWLPANYAAIAEEIDITITSASNDRAAILLYPTFTGMLGQNSDPELNYFPFRATQQSNGRKIAPNHINQGVSAATSKITFNETYMGAAEDGFVIVHLYIFGTTNADRRVQ